MHKFRFLPFSIAMALLLFWGAAAEAHLCILPATLDGSDISTKTYNNTAWSAAAAGTSLPLNLTTPSSSTYEICVAADKADGLADGIINIQVAPGGTGAKFALDVVYGQATNTVNQIYASTEEWKYNPDKMSDPTTCICYPSSASCSGGDLCTYPKVSYGEPLYFTSQFTSDFIDNDQDVPNVYIQVAQANIGMTLPPAAKENHLLSTSIFWQTYNDAETYTFEFNMTLPAVHTDILSWNDDDEEECKVLVTQCKGDGGIMANKQLAFKTKVTFTQPPCYTGKPGTATLTCPGQPGCTQTTGPAISTLNFTLPSTVSPKTGCYESNGTTVHTPCAGLKVKFVPPVCLVPPCAAVTKDQSQNPFTQDTTIEGTPTVGPVTIIGVSTSCADSDLGTGTNLGSVTAAAANCQCGAAPLVSLSNPTKEQLPLTKYAEGSNISLEFSVTLDPALSSPGDVEEIKFYYMRLGDTTLSTPINDPLTSLNSSGKFTAIIDKASVVEDAPIWFGVILRDSNQQYGYYPPTLELSVPPVVADLIDPVTGGFEIEGDQIFAGTQCDFVVRTDGSKYPYPSQFPYQAGSQILRIYFQVNDTASVSARIYSLDGTLIRHLDSNNAMGISQDNIDCSVSECNFCNDGSSKQQDDSGCIWDGTNYQGGNHAVANGMYIVNIHAVCTDKFSGGVIDHTKGIVVMK